MQRIQKIILFYFIYLLPFSIVNSQQNLDIDSINITKSYSKPIILLTGYIDKNNSEEIDYDFKIKLTNTDLDDDSKFYEPNKSNGAYSFNVEQCYHYDVQYYKLFTLSSGKVKEELVQEQTIKVPCEINEGLIISLPMINQKGELLKNNNYEIPNDSILEILNKKNKKYSFKEIINSGNTLIGLLLIDENGDIIDRAILTPDGFKFEILNSRSNYNFKLENFPDSLELSDIPIILLEDGKETLIHADFRGKNTFKYLNDFRTFKFRELVGLNNPLFKVYLIDENGKIVHEGLLTENGFKFEILNSGSNYNFKLENFPDSLELSDIPIILLEDGKETLIHADFRGKNTFKYLNDFRTFKFRELVGLNNPLFKVYLIDENGKIVHEGLLTENGFKFELISSLTKYKFKLENSPENLDLSEIPIELVNHGETLFVMGDFSKKNEFLLPKIHFKKTFQSNEYDIESHSNFVKFMDMTIKKIKENGKVNVEIVGSASRIPSTKFKNNTELAKLRIEKGKKVIYDYLDSKTISRNSLQIIKEKAIVSGPKYNNIAKDKSIYYQYQYFSIWVE